MTGFSYYLTTGPVAPTIPSSRFPIAAPVNISDTEIFWKGVNLYLGYTKKMVDNTVFGFGDVTSLGNNSYLFASTVAMYGAAPADFNAFMAPLFDNFRAAGINITMPTAGQAPYSTESNGVTGSSFPGS